MSIIDLSKINPNSDLDYEEYELERNKIFNTTLNSHKVQYIELDGDTVNNVDAFENVIRIMHDSDIGYGAVNHPVDRDPVCGYVGVIKDVCPRCGRHEGEGVDMEKLKERIKEYNTDQQYKLSMAIGESRLKNQDGVRDSISDWKMNADLDMYREKDVFHKANRRAPHSSTYMG